MARGRAAIPSTALQQPADPSRRLAPESRSRRDRFFAQLLIGAFTLVLIVASLITIVEKPLIFSSLGASVNGRGSDDPGPGRLVVCREPEYREHVGSGDVEPRRHQRPDERS
jgi:hypothetical protein